MIDYKELIPADFAPDSRVWVYQSSRLFMMSEALHVEDLLNNFAANWQSHGAPVKGYGNLFYGQFIVLMADEHGRVHYEDDAGRVDLNEVIMHHCKRRERERRDA